MMVTMRSRDGMRQKRTYSSYRQFFSMSDSHDPALPKVPPRYHWGSFFANARSNTSRKVTTHG